jgi:hypothetical protein
MKQQSKGNSVVYPEKGKNDVGQNGDFSKNAKQKEVKQINQVGEE